MIDSIVILLIIFFISCKFIYNAAYKKGLKECDNKSYNEGYKEGVECVEKEIKECCKLPDHEILKRVKNL